MTLYELIIAIILISLLTLGGITSIQHWKTAVELNAHQNTIGHLLGESRWVALAKDQSTSIKLVSSGCQFDNTDIPIYALSSTYVTSISNSAGMGFNNQGSTSRAATLTLKSQEIQKQITLSVGYGMLRIK
jgi:type II secretory pathway pseudopilin PulG